MQLTLVRNIYVNPQANVTGSGEKITTLVNYIND
jgi:hypothetical protein